MSRSIWKPLLILKENSTLNNKQSILIKKRNFLISSFYLNKKIKIYNGKAFINIFIDKDKLGYKFGEFSYTRKKVIHKTKKINTKKK